LKLKTVFESDDSPSIERTIKDIEKVFAIAKQYFPNEQFILEIESSFNELINNKNNAKDLLEKAFKANKASPFIALRLANFYERENDYLSASSVIRESLEQGNSGDRELNFKYGLLLEKRDEPNFDNIIYHLRRSFTMGDSRYQAQFWYARALYIKNEFVESKKIFDTLSKVNVSPDIKKTPTGKLRRSNQAMIFEGVIITVEVSYGFIRRDSFGDNLYFFRFEEDYNWDNFKSNKRVSFKIGFNYRGAVALNIRLI
jgi:tetratricopeptide (TPR) repeat protein